MQNIQLEPGKAGLRPSGVRDDQVRRVATEAAWLNGKRKKSGKDHSNLLTRIGLLMEGLWHNFVIADLRDSELYERSGCTFGTRWAGGLALTPISQSIVRRGII